MDYRYRLHDTAGFNDEGTAVEAMSGLFKLVCRVEGGVSLLFLVVRMKCDASSVKTYKLFYDVILDKNAPVVLVVTGLEHEEKLKPGGKRTGQLSLHVAYHSMDRGASWL
jgi:hypothetical protein